MSIGFWHEADRRAGGVLRLRQSATSRMGPPGLCPGTGACLPRAAADDEGTGHAAMATIMAMMVSDGFSMCPDRGPMRNNSESANGELQAVLFDMDGTLTDSEKLWSAALVEVVDELGGSLSDETRAAMVGTDLVSSVRMMLADLAVDADPAVVQRLLVEATARQFESSLEWRPGAADLVSAVRRAGLRTALVTATHRNLTSIALDTLGRENFDAIICGDDVTNSKPHPEPYRRGLDALGVTAQQAVAIEDSPSGSMSAVSAGLPTLVVPLEVPIEPRPGISLRGSLVGVTVETLREMLAAAQWPRPRLSPAPR